MTEKILAPDYLFEVSWEICNKVGGINTVIATKSLALANEYKDNFILVGPDLWRETRKNPVFIEDEGIFRSWREKAWEEGLRVRIGRWDIVGKPIVILIDFTSFIPKKDEIFKNFWERYHLDSISGGMDYIEAAIFGYSAGRVIESFYRHNLSVRDKVLAQFHEWMTGAGLLYLDEKVPQVATLFTTHATVVGRSIAGHGMDLYGRLNEYSGDAKARELNVLAKQSMEKISANAADCFTTVSEITARECQQFLEKKVDIITPNGFEDNFIPPLEKVEEKKNTARQKLFEVAEAVLGYEVAKDALLIANSGRYEFYNKGIDIFIDSMGALNKHPNLKKEVIAFVLVPANNYGPRKDLLECIRSGEKKCVVENKVLTHNLHDQDYDLILNEIKSVNLNNNPEDKVKIIYVPSYLDGYDGVFNLKYYDILIGLDLTVFPSYYEPWGYTPLESIAFSVPTITTNLAGIGMWVNKELVDINDGIDVFERKVGKDTDLIKNIADRIVVTTERSKYDRQRATENAYSISRIALWKNLIRYYKQAFHIALSKVQLRADKFVELSPREFVTLPKPSKTNRPILRQINVQSKLPEKLKGLDEIARNIWWSWNFEAADLFISIDEELWNETVHNPIVMLKEVSYERFIELENDENFMFRYNEVYNLYKAYLKEGEQKKKPKIAYFSMEFGLNDTLKIYSGGLGLLAGDYLKEASDVNIDMVGVGFLYKYGYFTQQLSIYGEQLATYEPQNFNNIPVSPVLDGSGDVVIVQVAFPGRVVYAKVWKVAVGRIPLYLLDTDFEMNSEEDRRISHQLYGGDNEHRLRQEMLLGIGGIRALDALGYEMNIYHCNEGHAAFIGLERLRKLINDDNFTFAESVEIVRSSTLFTTHTPVPAGHDSFPEDLMMIYMGHYPERLKLTWDEFMNLGRMNPNDKSEKFSMSYLAVNLSQEVNGVSRLHGEVTKHMFQKLWEGYYIEELHIGYVTNGVHMPTWIAKDWKKLYLKYFGKDFMQNQSNHDGWRKIYKVEDKEIWDLRQAQRKKLIDHIKERLGSNLTKRHVNPKSIVKIQTVLNENALTIGFARRFATYKRAHLLFEDIERLAKILNNPQMPIQFIFAGKAHPADGGGQGLIKKIVEISNRPEFMGKIIFLENYDIELAKKLVQGVDIWLNTPMRPLEASGTSGMKAVMNGVLNFSVLDGWWCEGYREGAGWALPEERTYKNNDFQDDLDAETIYGKLENEILPLFYKRDDEGVAADWVQYIKKCIAEIAPEFTTKRMIDDYKERYYFKMAERSAQICANDYELAKQISLWKKRIARSWDSIEVIEAEVFPNSAKEELILGKTYKGRIVLDLNEIADTSIGIELVITEKHTNGHMEILRKKEFEVIKKEGTKVYYEAEFVATQPGIFEYGVRIFPKHEALPHRMDFCYLRWV